VLNYCVRRRISCMSARKFVRFFRKRDGLYGCIESMKVKVTTGLPIPLLKKLKPNWFYGGVSPVKRRLMGSLLMFVILLGSSIGVECADNKNRVENRNYAENKNRADSKNPVENKNYAENKNSSDFKNISDEINDLYDTDTAPRSKPQSIIDDEPSYTRESVFKDEPDESEEAITMEGRDSELVDIEDGNSETAGETELLRREPLSRENNYDDFVTRFERYVEKNVASRVPGLALAIIADGKVKVLQTYGVKRVKGRDPITADTAFRLASVSKTIGGAASAMLVRDGLVDWNSTVTSLLPDLAFKNSRYGDQLTLRNILSQSTGLPTHTNDNFIEDGLEFDEVVRRLRYINFVCPPGKCYSYQNVTYSLISSIIFKKTGKTYEQYVKEKLFDPLGMNTASFGMAGLKANNNYALPHVARRKGWHTENITENYYRINPAAGANASITDMSRWILAQMGRNPEVLPLDTLKTLHEKITRNTPAQSHYGAREGVTDTHYGLGWRVFNYRGDKNFVHHGGYVLGFRSEMVLSPELQIGMVILSNSNRLNSDIIFKFLDAYEDDKLMIKRVALERRPQR
jgi:CubicO group peptidase (beta-lactamase class C family)